MKNEDRLSIENRLTRVETGMTSLNSKLDEIKDNHLAHLAIKVDRIQWILVTTLITLVVGLVMKIL